MVKKIRAFRIEDELWNRAVTKSQRDGVSVSEILRDSLVNYVGVSKKAKRKGVNTLVHTKGGKHECLVHHHLGGDCSNAWLACDVSAQ